LLHLLPSDTELELRVFTDNILIEVFFMGGRVVLTAPIQATEEAGFTAFASESMEVKKVQAWHIKPIWITPAEVANS
jgi:sucrose-6-phosphate hydrolase SacC (GH32 family)